MVKHSSLWQVSPPPILFFLRITLLHGTQIQPLAGNEKWERLPAFYINVYSPTTRSFDYALAYPTSLGDDGFAQLRSYVEGIPKLNTVYNIGLDIQVDRTRNLVSANLSINGNTLSTMCTLKRERALI